MEDALGDVLLIHRLRSVIRIRVEGLVSHNVILEQGFQIFCAVAAEEKCGDLCWKLLESEIRWSKDGTSVMVRCIIQGCEKSSFRQAKFQGTELSRQDLTVEDLKERLEPFVENVEL